MLRFARERVDAVKSRSEWTAQELAQVMHGDAVDLWNLVCLAETGNEIASDFPSREEIAAMQRTLSRLAWPESKETF